MPNPYADSFTDMSDVLLPERETYDPEKLTDYDIFRIPEPAVEGWVMVFKDESGNPRTSVFIPKA